MAVDFSGSPSIASTAASSDIQAEDRAQFSDGSGYVERASCRCYKTRDPGAVTETLAKSTTERAMAARDIHVVSMRWSERASLGKVLLWQGTSTAPQHETSLIGKIVYLPQCSFDAVAAMAQPSDLERAADFLNRIGTARP
jgi:hypothetical protein